MINWLNIKSKFHENKDWNLKAKNLVTEDEYHQEQVPRKQGLKHRPPFLGGQRPVHQEQVPRKQGLKLVFLQPLDCLLNPSRASSTKTRIETFELLAYSYTSNPIKSKFHENKDWNSVVDLARLKVLRHQEQVPRKQGLKHSGVAVSVSWRSTSRASSTKTRIETWKSAMNMISFPCGHQEQVPRKQGLKQ